MKHIDKLEVDKELRWTPNRVANGVLKFPDHYALLLTLKNIPKLKKKNVVNRKHIRWNTRKVNGWETYTKLTDNNNKLMDIVQNNVDDPETILKVFNKEMNKIKYKSFGKVTVSSKSKHDKRLELLQQEKQAVSNSGENQKDIESIDKEMISVMTECQNSEYKNNSIPFKTLQIIKVNLQPYLI